MARSACPILLVAAFAVLTGLTGCVEGSPTSRPALTRSADPYTPAHFAAASCRETNRARVANGLPPLRAHPALDAAADDQAASIALRLRAEHDSPLPDQSTPLDRIMHRGLKVQFCAENVASVPVGSGDAMATVDDIAAKLVESWMNSPGHRANVLNGRVTHVGCSVRLARGFAEQWYAFGVEDFARLGADSMATAGEPW